MAIETEAYVLRVHPMGESDRIVVLLSPREGKLRGVARHAALSRRRFGGSLSFLSQVRVRFVLKPGRDLVGLESCELVAPTPGEGRDLQAFYVCAYLAEILDHFSHEGQADESLYRLTRAVCQALSAGGSPVAMARYFEVWTLRLAGLLPALQGCPHCQAPLAQAGARVAVGAEPACVKCGAANPAGGMTVPASAVAHLQRILHLPPGDAALSAAASEDLVAIGEMTQAQFLAVVARPFRTLGAVSDGRRPGWAAAMVSP